MPNARVSAAAAHADREGEDLRAVIRAIAERDVKRAGGRLPLDIVTPSEQLYSNDWGAYRDRKKPGQTPVVQTHVLAGRKRCRVPPGGLRPGVRTDHAVGRGYLRERGTGSERERG